MIIENRRAARVFKAFSDENRLMILKMLQKGERCACKLLMDLNITQSTLSHHMHILCGAGVINARKEGKWTYYSLNQEGCERAIRLLAELLDPLFANRSERYKEAWMIMAQSIPEKTEEDEAYEETTCCVHMRS